METTLPERESTIEWTKKRCVGQPVREPKIVCMDSKEKDPCWKFVMELGDYRTEPEILADIHLRYPWVKLGRRNRVSGNAHHTAKDERSRVLLAGLRTLNGKTCITAHLLLQDEQVQDAERMPHWETTPDDSAGAMEATSLRKGPTTVLNCQKFGHMARTYWKENQTWRYCAGNHPSSQCKGNERMTLTCANCGEGHATTSRACPGMVTAIKKSKTAQAVDRTKSSTAPTTNAWSNLSPSWRTSQIP